MCFELPGNDYTYTYTGCKECIASPMYGRKSYSTNDHCTFLSWVSWEFLDCVGRAACGLPHMLLGCMESMLQAAPGSSRQQKHKQVFAFPLLVLACQPGIRMLMLAHQPGTRVVFVMKVEMSMSTSMCSLPHPPYEPHAECTMI